MAKLTLEIITQEKHVLTMEADAVVAPAENGEVTIMPNHIPLFTKLKDGIVEIIVGDKRTDYAIMGGFMDVGPSNKVTIMSDAAINADSVNEARALEAKKKAEQALKNKESEVAFSLAEADLRKALLELKVSKRQKSHSN